MSRLRLVGVVFVVALVAKADVPAFSIPVLNSPVNYQEGNPVVLGNVFTANSTFSVDGLGIYYDSTVLPDLMDSETVAIYDSSGDPLASAAIPATWPTMGFGFWFVNITPILLNQGSTYTVAAETGNNPWAYGPSTGSPPTSSDITFVSNSYAYSDDLVDPSNSGGSGPAYYGPNFEIETTTTTPEPGAVSLLIAIFAALAGVSGVFKRQPRKS